MMTVQELMEKLSDIPSDTPVMLKHELIGNEHDAESVTYNHGVVWIKETAD